MRDIKLLLRKRKAAKKNPRFAIQRGPDLHAREVLWAGEARDALSALKRARQESAEIRRLAPGEITVVRANPLRRGWTPAVVSSNIAELRRSGYPRRQAAAIAYSTARRSAGRRHVLRLRKR